MTTLEALEAQQAEMVSIMALAAAEALAVLNPAMSPYDLGALVRDLWPDLVAEFGAMAATSAADFYDEARSLAVAGGIAYAASLAAEPTEDDVQDSLWWALAPIFAPEREPDQEQAIDRLVGNLMEWINQQHNSTLVESAAADPVGTRYARYASADACTFCRLMATRGASYRSRDSAIYVTGEFDPKTSSFRRGLRGTRPEGEKYHDHCRCIVVPVFPGGAYEPPPYVGDWMDAYMKAKRLAGGAARSDLATILKHMRQLMGSR